MRLTHWIRIFVVVFVCAFGSIIGAQMLNGRNSTDAFEQAALWGAISAAVFTASAFYRWRRNIACALCDDITGVGAAREARAGRQQAGEAARPR